MSNRTGTYAVIDGVVRKVSETIPTLERPVYMPKGDLPHYDPSAKRRFESKAEKRAWLKQYGLREGGIVTPGKRWDGPTRNSRKLSWERKQEKRKSQERIRAMGGVSALLNQLQQKGA